ncbi:MAG: hypothetical protein ACR2G4_15125 [Pyrinomonadaceae bacterium]
MTGRQQPPPPPPHECEPEQPDENTGSLPAADLPEQDSEEIHIDYSPEAPRGETGRTIHQRLPYPTVPEGADVPDLDPSPPADIEPPRH